MGDLIQDVRYGTRMLTKGPGFTMVAVITLTLGIGANAAIFSVVNGILLRPLPFAEPDRLVVVTNDFRNVGTDLAEVSVLEFWDYREQGQGFENLAAYVALDANLTGADQPERVSAMEVSSNYFAVLGVEPALGRTFLPEDDRPGITEIAVISYGLWRRRFGAEPKIIGRTLRLDYDNYEIVGVMPPGFQHPGAPAAAQVDLWFPAGFSADPFPPPNRDDRRISLIGRLRPGVSLARAQSQMDATSSGLKERYPDLYNDELGYRVIVRPLREHIVGDVRRVLLILFGSVLLVLLIACANVSNLLLTRATVRQKEMVVRTALGATRRRLIAQLLTESTVLSMLGGVMGLLFSVWSVSLISRFAPADIPRLNEISTDQNVLAFTLFIAFITGIGFGLIPALNGSKADLNEVLKESGRGLAGSSHRNWAHKSFVISQFALALVLLVGAALLIRSFWRLQSVDSGFDPHNVLAVGIWLPYPNKPESGKYFRNPQRVAFYTRLLQQVETLPGVQSAGLVSDLPLTATKTNRTFTIEGRSSLAAENLFSAVVEAVSPNYFTTLGVALLRGRHFTEQDHQNSPGVVIINETMVRRFWPAGDPIGKSIKVERQQSISPFLTIVGIVKDIKTFGLDKETPDQIFVPCLQDAPLGMNLVVRTVSSPMGLAARIQEEVRSVDDDQPVFNVKTMDEILSTTTSQRRSSMLLITFFAVAALILASVGLYGVMSYSVTQRTHEIGIRMALGAEPSNIIKLIVGQWMAVAMIGLGTGLAAALALTRVMSNMLFGVSATDGEIFVITSLLLTSVAMVASYISGLRASRLQPMIALRHE